MTLFWRSIRKTFSLADKSRFFFKPVELYLQLSNLLIELLNEAGQLVMAYQVFNCWPIRYNPLGDLDANDSDFATERLVLIHEGWARDAAVAEPSEPTYTIP